MGFSISLLIMTIVLLSGCKKVPDEALDLDNRLHSWHVKRLNSIEVKISKNTSLVDVLDQMNKSLEKFDGVTQIQMSVFANPETFKNQLQFWNSPIYMFIPEEDFKREFPGTHTALHVLQKLELHEVHFNSILSNEGAVVLVNHSTSY